MNKTGDDNTDDDSCDIISYKDETFLGRKCMRVFCLAMSLITLGISGRKDPPQRNEIIS